MLDWHTCKICYPLAIKLLLLFYDLNVQRFVFLILEVFFILEESLLTCNVKTR